MRVLVLDVGLENAARPLVGNDDVIEAFPANRSDEVLDIGYKLLASKQAIIASAPLTCAIVSMRAVCTQSTRHE